ncbi:DUF1697 domain-containing protein [Sphingobacterium sp. DK4209]|uniref:DUF1697 domain-containing protein n=1 Tax=Sphingobacterium zhuxiongii TaxID=2662364 RepID=A0A5Q0QEW6_9SPHI|nr:MULTISPECIES: DUF1697 domain-containing protein [unclassified Sphingobacterium]MVZ65145.1 DUF1697 domain-containing protein [Sphingobacterium sp. DK4209]QGA26092.1 DUF1697 domain-containing protein [Sphingobacterium sp. dk4302]
MNTFVIFLRAVNVSGKNLIKMADLKDMLLKEGFTNVQTYIQSGNIILQSESNTDETRDKLTTLFVQHFNLDITCFALTEAELMAARDGNPFDSNLPGNRVFITFLSSKINDSERTEINKLQFPAEEFLCTEKHIYYYLPNGAANAKLSNSFFEKKLKIKATGRNINTVNKMLNLLAKTTK